MSFDDYLDILFNSTQKMHSMKTIRSLNHKINSFEIMKRSLSCYDSKRYILEDGKASLAYGHKKYKKGYL